MKPISTVLIVLMALSLSSGVSSTVQGPCDNKDYDNGQAHACYLRENERINAEVDYRVAKVSSRFNKEADYWAQNRSDVLVACLRNAAFEVTQAQRTWKAYREHHCKAILDAYTTGSGAGTAYEECEFRLGRDRLKELRTSAELQP